MKSGKSDTDTKGCVRCYFVQPDYDILEEDRYQGLTLTLIYSLTLTLTLFLWSFSYFSDDTIEYDDDCWLLSLEAVPVKKTQVEVEKSKLVSVEKTGFDAEKSPLVLKCKLPCKSSK
jgi:hypothetical protein